MAEITIKGVAGNPLNINVVMTAVENSMLNGEIITETVDFYPDTSKPVRAYLDSVTARKQYCPTTSVDGNIVYLSCDNMTAGVYTLTVTCTDTNGKARRFKSDACIEIYDITSAAEIAGSFDEQTYEMNGVFYTFGRSVHSDWDETNPESPAYILNKPDLSDYATDEELQAVEEQIPDVPEWAMQPQKPSYTAEEVGAVPTSRTVNGKVLSEDITLNAQDIGAQASIADLAQIREGAAKGATAYQKPSTGIAKTDLTNGIQQSLDRADTALQAAALTPLQNQIDTINNKIPTDATSTNELADKNYVERLLNEKQNTINDLDAIRRGAAKGDTAYQLPSNGMPKTDLAVSVQQSLNKANTAYQKPSAGIPKTDLAQDIQQRLDIPIDDEPTALSQNLVKSGGVENKISQLESESNLFLYIKQGIGTDFSLLKKAIKKIYWKIIPTEKGHYLTSFGYYAPNNWFYGQLRKSDGTLITTKDYDFDTFDGIFEIDNLVIIVNKNLFTGQSSVYLSDNCYLPEFNNGAITTDKIADGAITTGKIADKAITTNKIANLGFIFTKKEDLTFTTVNGFFYTADIERFEEGSMWCYHKIINLIPDTLLKITSPHAGLRASLWNFFDSSDKLISFSNDSSAVGPKSETIYVPNNAAYLIINSYVNDTIECASQQASYDANRARFSEQQTLKEYIDKAIPADKLYGKTLVCAGDSITYGTDMDAEGIIPVSLIPYYYRSGNGYNQVTQNVLANYGYQIASRHNMTFYNEGISGSTMQALPNNNKGFSLENGRYTTLPEHIDYLTIWFGWNDTVYGTLGTIDDITNESFYGGYNVVLPYLIDKYPYAKICLCVPFGCDVEHRQAIRNLANKWGLACWDNYLGGTPLYFGKEDSVGVDSNIISHNRQIFQANGAHPNFKGHKQIADMLEHFLQGI